MALERELKTYAGKLPELVAHSGKFVLIKDDEIVAIFDTYADALKTGYDRFKLDTFLVKQIAPEEHVLQFSRDLMVESPSLHHPAPTPSAAPPARGTAPSSCSIIQRGA